ncbi:MAG: hypothetical protein ACOYW4_01460 [Bacillota bacterium]
MKGIERVSVVAGGRKPIPEFKDLREMAQFWDTHDSTEVEAGAVEDVQYELGRRRTQGECGRSKGVPGSVKAGLRLLAHRRLRLSLTRSSGFVISSLA